MECVFCAIVAGAPAHRVADEPAGVAFLDVRPVFKGHVLVVPRAHVPVLADLPEQQLAPYFGLVRRVAAAVEAGLGAGGTFVAMNNRVSQSVPHLHTHVVPRTRGTGCVASSGPGRGTPTTRTRPKPPPGCAPRWADRRRVARTGRGVPGRAGLRAAHASGRRSAG